MIGCVAAILLLQDPVKFEPRLNVGDRTKVRIDSSLTLEVTTADSEGEKKKLLTLDSREEFEQTVSGSRQLEVKCAVSSRRKTWEGRPPVESTTQLEGRNFVLTWGDSLQVTTEAGEVAPAEAEVLGSWLSVGRLLPLQPKSLGEAWKIPAKELGEALWAGFEDPVGEVEVQFAAFDAHRATLALRGEVRGKTKDGFDGSMQLGETTLSFDTAAGRPISFLLTGTLSLTKRVVDRRPKPGSLTEEIEVPQGEVRLKSARFVVSVKFD